jgi:hypothetical protein
MRIVVSGARPYGGYANDLSCIFRTDVLCFPAVFLDSKHGETKSAD